MSYTLRFALVAACAAVLFLADPATAQVERETEEQEEAEERIEREERRARGLRDRIRHQDGRFPRGERRGAIIFRDEDGNVRRFELDGGEAEWEFDGPALRDTVIDGRRVIRFRTPGGEEEVIEFDMPDAEAMRFHLRDVDIDDFDMPDFEFEREGAMPFGRAFFGPERLRFENFMEGFHLDDPEARREMMELERRAHELAAELREGQSASLDRELDETLERLFDLRGQARAERAERLEERAEELRREAQELREALRERQQDRRRLIEERKRMLKGDAGSDW